MPSVGELLRNERLTQNRSVSEIAKELRISSSYLEAIETDNSSGLPGEFFHRSFIRQYATALGFPPERVKSMLDEAAPASEPISLEELLQTRELSKSQLETSRSSRIPTRLAVALFLVVMLGCSALFAVWNRAQEAADPVLQAEKALQRPSQAIPASDAPAIPETAQTASPATTVASPPTAPPQDSDEKRIDVALAAKEKTWVKVSSKGKTVYSGILDADQSRQFALEENARLLTGNAAALDVHVNGRSLGPLGARGQVRLVLLTQNRFQILIPRDVTN